MSEKVRDKKNSKLVIILMVVIIVLLIAGIVTAIVLFGKQSDDGGSSAESEDETEPAVTIGYEGNGIVALSEDELKAQWERMMKEAEEGMVDLEYKNQAVSTDGVNFSCKIGNSISNKYDMYAGIYLDDALTEQVVLTGLVPPGSEISSFKSDIPLDPGEYRAILVYTQVDDDHATIVAQTTIIITLVVGDE